MQKHGWRAALASATLVLAIAALSLLGAPSASAAPTVAADPVGTLTSTVTGTYTDAAGGVGTFTGTFTPSQFATNGDQLTATGTLAGDLVDSTGATQSVSQTQTFAVDDITAAATCQVLDLNLAPLDLNLLGLTVHLDRVHLNITAVPGAGNLLGNLVCAIAGLLNGPGALAQIAALLNQILALLSL